MMPQQSKTDSGDEGAPKLIQAPIVPRSLGRKQMKELGGFEGMEKIWGSRENDNVETEMQIRLKTVAGGSNKLKAKKNMAKTPILRITP